MAFLFPGCVHEQTINYYVVRRDMPVVVHVDSSFTFVERLRIKRAMTTWEKASNNRISFLPIWDVDKPGLYKDFAKAHVDQGIFLWRLDLNDSTHFTPIQQAKYAHFSGMFTNGPGENSGNIVLFESVRETSFYKVTLHELGHVLGLDHVETKENIVMQKRVQSNCITTLDAALLCNLYKCKPKAECS